MENRLKILFWLYRSKLNEKGLAPIYMRLTIASKRTELATGHFASPLKWDVKKGEVKGKNGPNQELVAKSTNNGSVTVNFNNGTATGTFSFNGYGGTFLGITVANDTLVPITGSFSVSY